MSKVANGWPGVRPLLWMTLVVAMAVWGGGKEVAGQTTQPPPNEPIGGPGGTPGKSGSAGSASGAGAPRLVREVILSEDQGQFKFGKTSLPEESKARLDELIAAIKSDPRGVYFEIEGHTDNAGSAEANQRLGLERAEAVKRYLYEAHQVPLYRIGVISYGEEKPRASNNTRDGRAQNRRVVVKVLD